MTDTNSGTVPAGTTNDASDAPTYEELAQIELDFEDVDTEIIARQEHLNRPIYARRQALTRRIQHFWPLVFEQAPPDIDKYIQPSDSMIFAAALIDMSMTRFEAGAGQSVTTHGPMSSAAAEFGEPRSLKFRFEFSENEWFEDRVVEKKFWFRRARNGWAGRVSEPVRIRWKKGKDPTNGLLDAAVKLFEAESKIDAWKGKGKRARPSEYEALKRKVEKTTEGSQSFFTWFGYRGPAVSVAESDLATRLHELKRQKAKGQTQLEEETEVNTNGNDLFDDKDKEIMDDEFEADAEAEVFPDGEELAVLLAEELWPSATKFFVAAQEADDISNSSFEASELEEEMEADLDEEEDHDQIEDEDEDEDQDISPSKLPDLRSLLKDDSRSGDKGKGKEDGPPSKKRRK